MKKSLCGELRGKAVFDLDTAISSDADKALKISEPQFEKKKKNFRDSMNACITFIEKIIHYRIITYNTYNNVINI